jgi:hypothetical protein
MVFLLCIFLALGKRWNDVSIMEENKTKRKIGGKIRGKIGGEIGEEIKGEIREENGGEIREESREENGGEIRKSINDYTKEFLLSLLTFFAAVNTICYIVYSITTDSHDAFYNKYFFTTSIWVILGNMRYLQIILVFNDSYSPTQALFKDKIIRYSVLLWILHISILLYIRF